MLLFFVMYCVIGAFAGTMSGLLGIGGGVVIVPALVFLFRYQHFVHTSVMHMAVGTSLAIMILTTSQSLYAHTRRQVAFFGIFRLFFPGIVVGVVGGAVLAHFLHSRTLGFIFSIIVLLIAVKMFFQKSSKHASSHRLPGATGCSLAGFLIGGSSGLLGLGGGTLTVPFLAHCRISMREAVVVSCAIGVTISIIGAASFAVTGQFAAGLPRWTTGYIYWPAWFGVVVGSLAFVRLGARLSHRLPSAILRRLFAVFMLVVGTHMLYSVIR